ncbi:MAG TPA: HAD-IA family hydrolase [Solirubrobacteraceae bacterium]|nr:HAD-IA family hydrolase [Solirubrobacteraceae bacterium]
MQDGGRSRAAPQLVIFDCDGVLVDSEPISNRVLAELLSAEGIPTTPAESRRAYQGLMLSEVLAAAEASLGRPLREGFLENYERERDAAFRRELRPVAGAAQAVERITGAGIAVCVASQGKLAKTRLTLEVTGLEGFFADDARFSAYAVERGKPAPDLFLHAAATMGSPPAGCVVVEDTPSGVSAAVAAGMRALGLAADSDERALSEAGAETIPSLAELPGRLGLD